MKDVLYEKKIMRKEANEKYYDLLEKTEIFELPNYVNYVSKDVLVQDNNIIGRKEEIIEYANKEIEIASKVTFSNKEIYLQEYKTMLDNAKKEEPFTLFMLKKQDKCFQKASTQELLEEISKIESDLKEYKYVEEEYKQRCKSSELGELGWRIYKEYSDYKLEYLGISTLDIVLAIEECNYDVLKDLLEEVINLVKGQMDEKNFSFKGQESIINKAYSFMKELEDRKELKLYEEIANSNMTTLEKGIAEEFIFRNEELREDKLSILELDFEKIKILVDKFINNDRVWEEINSTLDEEIRKLDYTNRKGILQDLEDGEEI